MTCMIIMSVNMLLYRDDDMMSTFSRVSEHHEGDAMGDDDDDDDDPTTSTSSFQNLPVDTSVSSKPSDSLASTVTNGVVDESVAAVTTTAEASNGKMFIHTFTRSTYNHHTYMLLSVPRS